MKNKTRIQILLASAALVLGAASASAQTPDAARIERGRYLVENIGGCADCHSTRDQKGQIIPALHLKGAPLAFGPLVPMPAWAAVSKPIAGLPGLQDDDVIHLLQTGSHLDGSMPRPPMPPFRYNEDDARSIVAYLRSLK